MDDGFSKNYAMKAERMKGAITNGGLTPRPTSGGLTPRPTSGGLTPP
jgi:hypothetical protein